MLPIFPLEVLDEIWDVIESVSEGFLTYSSCTIDFQKCREKNAASLNEFYNSWHKREHVEVNSFAYLFNCRMVSRASD